MGGLRRAARAVADAWRADWDVTHLAMEYRWKLHVEWAFGVPVLLLMTPGVFLRALIRGPA